MKLKNHTTLFSALLWFHLKLLCFLIHRVKKCSRHNTRSECPTHVSHPRFLKTAFRWVSVLPATGREISASCRREPSLFLSICMRWSRNECAREGEGYSVTRHKRRCKKVQCSPCFLQDAAKITVIAVKLEPGWLHSIFLTISIKVFMIGEHLKGGFVW